MSLGFFFFPMPSITVYKLCRLVDGKLYPLYVNANKEIKIDKWLPAEYGKLVDPTHVKSCGCGGRLALRPGWHTTTVPWTDWIGAKMPDGTLARKPDHVWCECEIRGKELTVENRNGLRTIPNGYYRFKTNSKQRDPWIISGEIKVNRILPEDEVSRICIDNGLEPQKLVMDYTVEQKDVKPMKKKLENYILKKVMGGSVPIMFDGTYYYYNDGYKVIRSRQKIGTINAVENDKAKTMFEEMDGHIVNLPTAKEIDDGIKSCNSKERIGVRISKDSPLVNARWLKDAVKALNAKVMYVSEKRNNPVRLFEDDDLQSDHCLAILPIGSSDNDEGYRICCGI